MAVLVTTRGAGGGTHPAPQLPWAWGLRKEAAAQSLVTELSPRAGPSAWHERETFQCVTCCF